MKLLFASLLFFFLSLVLPPLSFAQGVNIPSTFFNSHPGARRLANSPGSLITGLLPNVIILAGAVLLFVIALAGYSYIEGSGKQLSPAEMSRRNNILTAALVGFLLVVSAYFILRIVGIVTGINFTNPPPL